MSKKRLIFEYDKYKIMFNTAYSDYTGPETVEIGKVVDNTTGEDVMYVYYSRRLYKEQGYHICVNIYENETGEYPVAMVDDMHRSCLFEDPDVFLASMLHEYGHYVHGDLNAEGLTNASIQEDRARCIAAGRVQERERKADAFAVRYVGKDTFLRSLDYLIEKRKQRGDDAMGLAIREFELRKTAVKKM